MGTSSAAPLNVVKMAWTGVQSALYPERPPLKSGDLEEGSVAAKKETGYGELQRVLRELSPAQIPHLLVITLLTVQVIKAAANGSVVKCTLHSAGVFVVYRDLATGGFYTLAIQALKGQIAEIDRLAQEVTNVKNAATLIEAAGGNVDEAVNRLVEQINRLEEATAKSEAAAAKFSRLTDELDERVNTPIKQRRRSQSFSGITQTPS